MEKLYMVINTKLGKTIAEKVSLEKAIELSKDNPNILFYPHI